MGYSMVEYGVETGEEVSVVAEVCAQHLDVFTTLWPLL